MSSLTDKEITTLSFLVDSLCWNPTHYATAIAAFKLETRSDDCKEILRKLYHAFEQINPKTFNDVEYIHEQLLNNGLVDVAEILSWGFEGPLRERRKGKICDHCNGTGRVSSDI